MGNRLAYIIDQIAGKNPLHGKKLKKNQKKYDGAFLARAEEFLQKYEELLTNEEKTIDYAIECYLQMLADVNYESVQFMQTGVYSSNSFEEVNKRVYGNPEVMEYYMHGLLLSQFLWLHHYDILLYFNQIMHENSANIKEYLEVGGGHGLYISEATHTLNTKANYDLVDISLSSLTIAKKMISYKNVNFIHSDVFKYFPDKKFDFITMGEVMEHVEDPIKLLKKLHSLLNNNGKLFITTPTNAPAIDHIYLFKNANDIRNVIKKAGFNIEKEACIYSEDLPEEIAEQYKISMMFAGLLTKNK